MLNYWLSGLRKYENHLCDREVVDWETEAIRSVQHMCYGKFVLYIHRLLFIKIKGYWWLIYSYCMYLYIYNSKDIHVCYILLVLFILLMLRWVHLSIDKNKESTYIFSVSNEVLDLSCLATVSWGNECIMINNK